MFDDLKPDTTTQVQEISFSLHLKQSTIHLKSHEPSRNAMKKFFDSNCVTNIWIASVLSFSFLLCGASRTFTVYLVSHLSQDSSDININSNEASWLGSISSLCNPIGFLCGGFSMDILGRKWSTKFLFLPFIAGWVLITSSSSLLVIYIGIGLHGIAAGMTMISSVYVSEIASSDYRGFSLSLLNLSYMLGIVICSIFQNISSWRCTSNYFLASSIMMFGASSLLPESPYWLVMKGRIEDAIAVLNSVRGCEPVSNNIKNCLKQNERIQKEIEAIEECVLSKKNIEHETSQNGNRKLSKISSQLHSLLSIRKQMLILVVLALLHKISGFVALGHYTVTFFADLQLDLPMSSLKDLTLMYSIVCFTSTLFVPYCVHFYDRRILLSVSCVVAGIGMSTALVYECLFHKSVNKPYLWIPVFGIYIYAAASSIGITSVLIMLPAEILPRQISGLSTAVYNILCSFITTAISKTYFNIVETIYIHGLLGTFSASCFTLAFLSLILLPETRGKSLLDIQKLYLRNETRTKYQPNTTA